MMENARTSELETRYESWWWGEDEEEEEEEGGGGLAEGRPEESAAG
jgi:hypothetical protein